LLDEGGAADDFSVHEELRPQHGQLVLHADAALV
jgi:hypothetical protein